MEQAVNNFINELKARIELLNNVNSSLDSTKVDSIENIIDKYGVIDTERYNPLDVEYILKIMDYPNLKDYKKIDKAINNYIEEFNKIYKNNNESRNKEIDLYNKYIDILSNDLDEVFVDYEELNSLMSNVFTQVSDKWKIIAYIDSKNIKLKEPSILAINLNTKLTVYNKLYLSNDKLTKYINDYLNTISIDVDNIPSIANKLVNNTYSYDEIKNALAVIVLNELYQQLLCDLKDTNLIDMINNTLTYVDSYEDKIINPCKDLIIDYEDLLNEELNKGNNINDYMNISLEDLDKLVDSHEKAVKLRALPIIFRIKTTLDNISETSNTSDEYIDYLKLLSDLNNAYKEIKEV